MSDRDLIARACCGAVGAEWGDRPTRERCYLYADAVLAALGATSDDVLVALPRAKAEWIGANWCGSTDVGPWSALDAAIRAALARGRREPVTVTLDHDDAESLRGFLGDDTDFALIDTVRIVAALDAALGGES